MINLSFLRIASITGMAITLLLLHQRAGSQSLVYGRTLDSVSMKIVSLATVTNLNKGRSVVSNYSGRFAIVADIGNLLVTSFAGYGFDTVRVTPEMINDSITIRMNELSTNLPGATVTAKSRYTLYQRDSLERREQHAGLLSKKNLKAIEGPANGSGFGISVSLDRYSKHEKQKRKAKELFELMEEQAYVNYRFSEQEVTKYTGFKEEALVNFMNEYRPTYDWLRSHAEEEDMVNYINGKLKQMRK